MFNRMFGRKSHETQTVNGVEIGRPVIGSVSVPSQSFSTNQDSREGSPTSGYHPTQRQKIRRRPVPAPLQLGSLTTNWTNGYQDCNTWDWTNVDGNGVSPVCRTAAVRYPVNPLTRRQTFSSVENESGRQENYWGTPELPGYYTEPRVDGTHFDLSTPFIPAQQSRSEPQPQNFPRDTDNVGPAQPKPVSQSPAITPHPTYYPGDLPQDEVEHLPSRLKAWVNTGMTACDIGRYAARMLDGRDKFLSNCVTLLVDAKTPYTNIGRAVLKLLDIRDEVTNEPLYDKIPSGFKELEPRRPLFAHDHVGSTYNPIHGLEHPN